MNCVVMFRDGPFLHIFLSKSPKLATQSVIVAALISSLGAVAAAACGRATLRKEGETKVTFAPMSHRRRGVIRRRSNYSAYQL